MLLAVEPSEGGLSLSATASQVLLKGPSKVTAPVEKSIDHGRVKSKRRLVVLVLLVLTLIGASSWLFFSGVSEQAAPEPGEVQTLEPLQLNLAAGRYLRVGIALQLTTDVKDEVDGSKALDAAIGVFSGLSIAAVEQLEQRDSLKRELEKELGQRYEGDVMGVYFTEFVTQ